MGVHIHTCKHTHRHILSNVFPNLSAETHLSCPDRFLIPPSCHLLSPVSCPISPFYPSLTCPPTLSCSPNTTCPLIPSCSHPPDISLLQVISHPPRCPPPPSCHSTPAVILLIKYLQHPFPTSLSQSFILSTYTQLPNLRDPSKPPFSSSLQIHHQVLGAAPWESTQDLLSHPVTAAFWVVNPRGPPQPFFRQWQPHPGPAKGGHRPPTMTALWSPSSTPTPSLPCVPRGPHRCKH